MADAVAFEPHERFSRVVVAVQTLDEDVELEQDKPYVTDEPGVIAALDAAEGVKRVARAETKKAARDKAEAQS